MLNQAWTHRAIALSAALTLGFAAHSARADEPLVAGAIGDSISAGFDAVRVGDNREFSWSTGTAPGINSHLKRLSALRGQPVTAFNEAIAGSVVADLDRQITRLITKSPDYVTVTIGANDICGWSGDYQADLAAFRSQLSTEVKRLVAARPNIKVLLASIPDMYNLWEVGSAHPQCAARWRLFGVCSPLLGADATTADRQAFVERWQAANDAISDVAAEMPANVLHNPDLAHVQFSWEDISTLDCFHPSVIGQNLLAEKTWQLLVARP